MHHKRSSIFVLVAVMLLTVALALSACGSPDEVEPTPSAAPTGAQSQPPSTSPTEAQPGAPSPSPSGSLSVISVYFMRGQFVGAAHRAVPVTSAPAGAAMRQLLVGPTEGEQAAGLHSQIPPGTTVLGITIRDGVAIVDLSVDFAAGVAPLEDRGRLAQVVYTLTQFPTVEGVRFRIEGEPLVFRSGEGAADRRPQTRASFEDVTPAIFVELPAPGDHVGSPLIVTGTANTFEAQFFVRVRDAAGKSLVNKSVMATSGSGTRGTFNESVDFSTTSPNVTLEVYESSAADGRPVHVVRIPLFIDEGVAQ